MFRASSALGGGIVEEGGFAHARDPIGRDMNPSSSSCPRACTDLGILAQAARETSSMRKIFVLGPWLFAISGVR